jgi:hypothetical protein
MRRLGLSKIIGIYHTCDPGYRFKNGSLTVRLSEQFPVGLLSFPPQNCNVIHVSCDESVRLKILRVRVTHELAFSSSHLLCLVERDGKGCN